MYRGEHARGGDGVIQGLKRGDTVGCIENSKHIFIFRAAVVVSSKFFVLG
jgi:hypothetical protein